MGKRIAKPEDFGRVESRIIHATLPERYVRLQFTLGRKVVWSCLDGPCGGAHRTRNDHKHLMKFARKEARKVNKLIGAAKFVVLALRDGKWVKEEEVKG